MTLSQHSDGVSPTAPEKIKREADSAKNAKTTATGGERGKKKTITAMYTVQRIPDASKEGNV